MWRDVFPVVFLTLCSIVFPEPSTTVAPPNANADLQEISTLVFANPGIMDLPPIEEESPEWTLPEPASPSSVPALSVVSEVEHCPTYVGEIRVERLGAMEQPIKFHNGVLVCALTGNWELVCHLPAELGTDEVAISLELEELLVVDADQGTWRQAELDPKTLKKGAGDAKTLKDSLRAELIGKLFKCKKVEGRHLVVSIRASLQDRMPPFPCTSLTHRRLLRVMATSKDKDAGCNMAHTQPILLLGNDRGFYNDLGMVKFLDKAMAALPQLLATKMWRKLENGLTNIGESLLARQLKDLYDNHRDIGTAAASNQFGEGIIDRGKRLDAVEKLVLGKQTEATVHIVCFVDSLNDRGEQTDVSQLWFACNTAHPSWMRKLFQLAKDSLGHSPRTKTQGHTHLPWNAFKALRDYNIPVDVPPSKPSDRRPSGSPKPASNEPLSVQEHRRSFGSRPEQQDDICDLMDQLQVKMRQVREMSSSELDAVTVDFTHLMHLVKADCSKKSRSVQEKNDRIDE